MNRLVGVVQTQIRLYQTKKKLLALPEGIKTISAVIMALLGSHAEQDIRAKEIYVDNEKFHIWLAKLKVRKSSYDVPNLSLFLSSKTKK